MLLNKVKLLILFSLLSVFISLFSSPVPDNTSSFLSLFSLLSLLPSLFIMSFFLSSTFTLLSFFSFLSPKSVELLVFENNSLLLLENSPPCLLLSNNPPLLFPKMLPWLLFPNIPPLLVLNKEPLLVFENNESKFCSSFSFWKRSPNKLFFSCFVSWTSFLDVFKFWNKIVLNNGFFTSFLLSLFIKSLPNIEVLLFTSGFFSSFLLVIISDNNIFFFFSIISFSSFCGSLVETFLIFISKFISSLIWLFPLVSTFSVSMSIFSSFSRLSSFSIFELSLLFSLFNIILFNVCKALSNVSFFISKLFELSSLIFFLRIEELSPLLLSTISENSNSFSSLFSFSFSFSSSFLLLNAFISTWLL